MRMNNKENILREIDEQSKAVKLVFGECSTIYYDIKILRDLIVGFSEKIPLPIFKHLIRNTGSFSDIGLYGVVILRWRVSNNVIILNVHQSFKTNVTMNVFMENEVKLPNKIVSFKIDDIQTIESTIIEELNRLNNLTTESTQ